MPYIKNIEHEKVVNLAGEVQVMPGQVVSKTLAQNDAVESFKMLLTVVFPQK